MGRKLLHSLSLIFLIIPLTLSSSQDFQLPEKYLKWIEEEVVYIITPKEKDVFWELENDRERDMFIEEFWEQRDPTPGTPKNEFKEEHYRRIEFANEKFGRGGPLDGWRTDRGKTYIILGIPNNVEKYLSMETYPIEIWYYEGNTQYGQPPYFRLMFFQKRGVGHFQLYDPITDGPRSLVPYYERDHVFSRNLGGISDLTPSDIERQQREQEELNTLRSKLDDRDIRAYRILKNNVGLELAEASLSNFPGRRGPDYLLASSTLTKEIDIYPHRKVMDDYAVEFLEHKSVVEVDYSVFHIGSQAAVNVIQDPSGIFFVHYVIVPDTLSVDLYQDKYFTNLKASVRVTSPGNKTIFQWERNVPIELKKEELNTIGKRAFHFFDSFPLIPGRYTFNLLLENTVTKEFTSLERKISVPDAEHPHMSPLILTRKVNKDSPYSQEISAFQIGNLQVYPSPQNLFNRKDKLFLFFQLYSLSQELKEEGQLKFTFYRRNEPFHSEKKDLAQYENKRDFIEEFSLDKFFSGNYKLRVSLLNNEGQEILFKSVVFSISQESLPGSWVVAQTNPPTDDPLYSCLLGLQLMNSGDIQKAHHELAKAYEREPDSLDYALSYAKALMILKRFHRLKEILIPFVDSEKGSFDLYFYLGRAFQKTDNYQEAITNYKRALSHKGNIAAVLNFVGECHFALGNKQQALKAWEKSLEINPDQEKVKTNIKRVKKEEEQKNPKI